MSHEPQAAWWGVLWAVVKAMGSSQGTLGSCEGHGFLCFLFLPSGRLFSTLQSCPYTKYSLLLLTAWGWEGPRPPAMVLSCNIARLIHGLIPPYNKPVG